MTIETQHRFFTGLDLGQSADFSALTIVDRTTQHYGERERFK